MNCPGLHCPSCGQTGAGGAVIAVIAGALAWHERAGIAETAEVVFWTLLAAAVLVVAGLGAAVVRVLRAESDPTTVATLREAEQAAAVQRGPSRRQLEARIAWLELQQHRQAPAQHIHLHGVSAEDVAAIVRRQARP